MDMGVFRVFGFARRSSVLKARADIYINSAEVTTRSKSRAMSSGKPPFYRPGWRWGNFGNIGFLANSKRLWNIRPLECAGFSALELLIRALGAKWAGYLPGGSVFIGYFALRRSRTGKWVLQTQTSSYDG